MHFGRKVAGATSLTLVSAAIVAHYYRPIGDNEIGSSSGPKRDGTFTSKDSLCDRANVPPPVLYRIASSSVVFATAAVTRVFMYLGGKFRVEEDENYYNFIRRVKGREDGVPLLTVRLLLLFLLLFKFLSASVLVLPGTTIYTFKPLD